MKVHIVVKGGKGSGFHGHAGRPGQVGGSSSNGNGRVWRGVQEQEGAALTKLEVGAIGEAVAHQYLSEKYGATFETMNKGINNSPIDLAGDHAAVEVKTGIVTNAKRSQHWRATIGQPGKAERELLEKMTPEEKREFNRYKQEQILSRKYSLLRKMSEAVGEDVRPVTIGILLSADGKKADVFEIEGFHLYLAWSKYAVDDYYVGTYDVE